MTSRPRTIVLRDDADLGAVVRPERREEAIRASLAAALMVPPGTWDARRDAAATSQGHGLLVLDGMLVRRVGLGRRSGAELLGPGDLLRPREHDGEAVTLPFEATWQVVTALRMAVLDRSWSYRMAAFPEVGIALTARAMQRSRRLANTLVIAQHPRLDTRLLLLFWEIADRHGKVTTDGVRLELRLTHELLSQLAGARRPSVSHALAGLAEAELVERTRSGWLLRGDPPDREVWNQIRGARSAGRGDP